MNHGFDLMYRENTRFMDEFKMEFSRVKDSRTNERIRVKFGLPVLLSFKWNQW